MQFVKKPHLAVAVAIVLALSSAILGPPAGVQARQDVLPMPGERFLTPEERDTVLDSMRPGERELFGKYFAEDATGLVVGYARREGVVTDGPNGSKTIEPVGMPANPDAAVSLPSTAVADGGTKPGTDLYVSIIVVRTRTAPPYEWEVQAYADWMAGETSMDAFNASEDSMGVAWGGGLYLYSDSPGGQYKLCDGVYHPLNIYRSDATPNVGVGYSFNEWKKTWPCYNTPMRYAWGGAVVREDTWQNTTSNVVNKYFHTHGGLDYSLGFSAAGPSVSISPTSEQWSFAVYTSFSH